MTCVQMSAPGARDRSRDALRRVLVNGINEQMENMRVISPTLFYL